MDQAVQNAANKCNLPKDNKLLLPVANIKAQVACSKWSPYHKIGVAEAYKAHTSTYCHPIASTLSVHPLSNVWYSALIWTLDQRNARWAITDRVLCILANVTKNCWTQELMQNKDIGRKTLIEHLTSHGTALTIWEMKSLTIGTAQVMEEIIEMGINCLRFPWQKCTGSNHDCTHHSWRGMDKSKMCFDPGFNACLPPWTLPIIAADSQPTPLRDGLRSTSAQGGATTSPSYKEHSLSFVEDSKEFGTQEKRHCEDSNASEEPALKKSKTDLMDEQDEFYELPLGAWKEATAKSLLQQVT